MLNIQLRVVHYANRKATADWAQPDEAYMPATIDKEADAFAKVAGQTPGLIWADLSGVVSALSSVSTANTASSFAGSVALALRLTA